MWLQLNFVARVKRKMRWLLPQTQPSHDKHWNRSWAPKLREGFAPRHPHMQLHRKRSANPSFFAPLKLRTSGLRNQ